MKNEIINEKNSEKKALEEQKENEEKGVVSKKKDPDIIKDDPSYKSGKRLYDIGLILFSVILVLNLARYFLNIEFYIGGMICTSYVLYLYLVPCIFLIIGLIKANTVSKKMGVKVKGDKGCLIMSIVLAVIIIVFGVLETIRPSYHVYEIENISASDGREFLLAKSETVTMFGEWHDEMPSFYNIDVYNVNGVFAKKIISCSAHNGEYKIEKTDDGTYKLVISFLGRKESYPLGK